MKHKMSSLEAAALIATDGATDDVEQANLMTSGQILDPEALQRAYYRRIFGFDLDVRINEDKHQAYCFDTELGLSTSCTYLEGDENIESNSKRLSRACIRLKKMHDKKLEDNEPPEAEIV